MLLAGDEKSWSVFLYYKIHLYLKCWQHLQAVNWNCKSIFQPFYCTYHMCKEKSFHTVFHPIFPCNFLVERSNHRCQVALMILQTTYLFISWYVTFHPIEFHSLLSQSLVQALISDHQLHVSPYSKHPRCTSFCPGSVSLIKI